jgi:hypothetical protein
VSDLTSRTVFRWTPNHEAAFERFVSSREWVDARVKSRVPLDRLLIDLGLDGFQDKVNALGDLIGPIIEKKVRDKLYRTAKSARATEPDLYVDIKRACVLHLT